MPTATVNGRRVEVRQTQPLNYADLLALAGYSPVDAHTGSVSVTVSGPGVERSVSPGQSVATVDGLIINAYRTGMA